MLFAMEVRQDIFQPDKEEEQLYMMDISVCINTGNKCIKITMCLELILWMKSCQTDMVSHGAGFTTKFFFTVKWKCCSYCLFLLYFLNCIYTKRSNCDCTFDHVTIKTFNVKCNQNVGPRGERVDSQTTTCLKYKAPSHPHSHTHSHMNKRYKKQCMESNSISTSRFVSQAEKKKKKKLRQHDWASKGGSIFQYSSVCSTGPRRYPTSSPRTQRRQMTPVSGTWSWWRGGCREGQSWADGTRDVQHVPNTTKKSKRQEIRIVNDEMRQTNRQTGYSAGLCRHGGRRLHPPATKPFGVA